MANKERHLSLLVCKFCKQTYTSKRSDSDYCSPAHRTAAYRERLKAQEKFRSLHTHYQGESFRIQEIRKKLIVLLQCILEFEKQYKVPLSSVEIVCNKMQSTTQTWMGLKTKALEYQIDWIWSEVEGFLFMFIRDSKKQKNEICDFHLPINLRDGIEKLIKVGR